MRELSELLSGLSAREGGDVGSIWGMLPQAKKDTEKGIWNGTGAEEFQLQVALLYPSFSLTSICASTDLHDQLMGKSEFGSSTRPVLNRDGELSGAGCCNYK